MKAQNASPFLSVVVPAYNEEQRLPETLAQILAYLERQPYTSELIVADDGSTDRTAALVKQTAAQHPVLRLLQLDHRGKGFTVRAGALAARGEYVLLCDADLAVPIEEWEQLHQALTHGYDVAIGSREGAGSQREGEPWYRHFMGRVFNMIVQVVAVRGIQDTQCGFKALRAPVAADLFRRVQLYGENAPRVEGAAVTAYDVELLFLARQRGYRIAEVPMPWRYGTETKVSPLRDSLRNLRDVLVVRWYALRGRYRDLHAPLPGPKRGAGAPQLAQAFKQPHTNVICSYQTIAAARLVMTAQPKPFITEAEYLEREWASDSKHEYYAGAIFAMSGASEQHNLIASNVTAAFHRQLRGRPCRVYPSDMRLKVTQTGLNTYPDITIVCGPSQFTDQLKRDTLINPTVVIEILSPSTERYDRGLKFQNYRTIDSLQEYILIAQDTRHIERYARYASQQWLLAETVGAEAVMVIESIGVVLDLNDVYEHVDLPATPDSSPPAID